jgi:hypothetical protein
VLRCAPGDDAAPVRPAARAHVDEVVSRTQQVEIVVDDDDGGPGIEQPVEDTDERADVQRMQPG